MQLLFIALYGLGLMKHVNSPPTRERSNRRNQKFGKGQREREVCDDGGTLLNNTESGFNTIHFIME